LLLRELSAPRTSLPSLKLLQTPGGSEIMADGAHILFVDDEEGVRLTLAPLLESRGFRVTCAATVQDALTLITKSKFDVLLADLNIGQPGDGFTVVSAMRRTHPETVTLILTGYPDFQSALQAIRQQVDDFLTKPTEISLLVETIKSKLANRTPERHVRLQRLPDLIHQEQKRITEDWLASVKNDGELQLVPISDSERVDHLPSVLEAAIHVAAGNQVTAQAMTVAALHGNIRSRQGYTVPLIMRESTLLQAVVARRVQENLLVIDISTLIPDLISTYEAIGTLAEVSVRSFLAAAR
jgi:ActR/RegA family two-component response regulator